MNISKVHLTLVPLPGDEIPVEVRLRRLLKATLRAHGFRCTRVLARDGSQAGASVPDAPAAAVDDPELAALLAVMEAEDRRADELLHGFLEEREREDAESNRMLSATPLPDK